MTSPALFVLSLALVCSICGIASEQTADYDSTDKMTLPKLDVTMGRHWTNQFDKHYLHNEILDDTTLKSKTNNKIFEENDTKVANVNMRNMNIEKYHSKKLKGLKKESKRDLAAKEKDLAVNGRDLAVNERDLAVNERGLAVKERDLAFNARVKREAATVVAPTPATDPRCDSFKLDSGFVTHPHNSHSPNKYYYNNSDCVTVLEAPVGSVVKLTFVDMFRIEYHPQCTYDFLEIRDGLHGYAKLIDKVCGQAFPRQMTSTGPYMWLKFHSDDTIEYEGFKIIVEFKVEGHSHKIPDSCYKTFTNLKKGAIDEKSIGPECKTGSANQPLDVLWTIITDVDHKIYLNFTKYELKKPNECEENVIQVFGSVIELDKKLAQYCGSVANSVTTLEQIGNIMHVRFFASQTSKDDSKFRASFNAYRMLNQALEGVRCRDGEEFDCEDNTCIDISLACDNEAHCRLKADEEPSHCKRVQSSAVAETHIMVILIIFSLILSSMSFVFLFKCIRKLYQDHKIIKEHLRRSTEDRLDTIEDSRLTLDPQKLQRDSEPRASLDRDNQTNEMYKRKRSFSKHKQSSIDSDYIIETQIDLEEEPWRREVDSMPIEAEDIRIERNGRTRRSDLSRKEESMRSRTKETDDRKERKEIRDVSVGAPDTKESGCQTRESLFQTDPPPSSDDSHYCMAQPGFEPKTPAGLTAMRLNSSKQPLFSILSFSGSGTNSRGFSTFGYSGATIARRSPPVATNTSEIKIELLKQIPPEPKLQKKVDRRPISTETTRSAPDVIIVSKPIR